MASLETKRELNRLASVLARAVPGSTVGYAELRELSGGAQPEIYAKVIVDTPCPDGTMDEARVITTARATDDEAVAELRAILRADADEAVAELRAEVARLRGLLVEFVAADAAENLTPAPEGTTTEQYVEMAQRTLRARDALRAEAAR